MFLGEANGFKGMGKAAERESSEGTRAGQRDPRTGRETEASEPEKAREKSMKVRVVGIYEDNNELVVETENPSGWEGVPMPKGFNGCVNDYIEIGDIYIIRSRLRRRGA